MPDRLYVMIKENFAEHGLFHKKVRSFTLPTFREKTHTPVPINKNHKKIRPKKQRKATQKRKDTKILS